jgi:hypothetical protein
MALKKSERTLVGVALLMGGLSLFMLVGLPQWDAFSASSGQVTALQEEIKGLEARKTALDAQVSLLMRNTDIPPGIAIRKYNEQNRASIIKELLDHVVNLATDSGNRFISLVPAAATPILPPAAPASASGATANKAAGNSATTASTPSTTAASAGNTTASGADQPDAALPQPVLNTFGYDLAVRGTYDTLQRFLKSMEGQRELLEITDITLENEAAGPSGSANTQMADPAYPIRLTASVRIALQPEN